MRPTHEQRDLFRAQRDAAVAILAVERIVNWLRAMSMLGAQVKYFEALADARAKDGAWRKMHLLSGSRTGSRTRACTRY